MNDKILIDTSVWVSFFRNQDNRVSQKLKNLLRNGNPYYTGLIAAELLRGAKLKNEIEVLENLFKSIGYFTIKEEYFRPAGELGRSLMQKGITVGTVDLLIAQTAMENNAALFSLDSRFPSIARYSPLQLY